MFLPHYANIPHNTNIHLAVSVNSNYTSTSRLTQGGGLICSHFTLPKMVALPTNGDVFPLTS
jgi:hypothetical protein